MKKTLGIIFFFLINVIQAQNYQLIWSDEFGGDLLDENIWTKETGAGGWGNGELQYYTDREVNSTVSDGTLKIKAMAESYHGSSYTSARIKTQGVKFWKYGKIEARLKLPYGQGIWPAFWMLGENISSAGWPACGEIDIMEKIGGDGNEATVYGTLHWEQNGHAQYGGSYTLPSGYFQDEFHLFTAEWDEQKVVWYVDGIQYHVIDITPSGLSEFHDEFFIILNVAVGGEWPGYPNATTVFPQVMEVDYVRVYKKKENLPAVYVTAPFNNTVVSSGSDIEVAVQANFSKGIEKVDFFQGSMKIGETNVISYKMNWLNLYPGQYRLNATAYSENGLPGFSPVINITVEGNPTTSPYAGYPHSVPGIIEAEDYDISGTQDAWADGDSSNLGEIYRTDGVDIQKCFDEYGEYEIYSINSGEYLTYTVDCAVEAQYLFELRSASEIDNGKIKISLDGTDLFGEIIIPNSGGSNVWEDVITDEFLLTAGIHEVKIMFTGGDFKFNRFGIYEPATVPSVEINYPVGGEVVSAGQVMDIRWESLKVEDVKIGFSSNGGTSWEFVSEGNTAKFGAFRWKTPQIESDECTIMIIDAENSNLRSQSGSFTINSSSDVDEEDPCEPEFALMQNYPNPFNPETNISFTLPDREYVRLKIFDLEGREVATLVDEPMEAGIHSVTFAARDHGELSTGIYFYIIETGSYTDTKKMLYLK